MIVSTSTEFGDGRMSSGVAQNGWLPMFLMLSFAIIINSSRSNYSNFSLGFND